MPYRLASPCNHFPPPSACLLGGFCWAVTGGRPSEKDCSRSEMCPPEPLATGHIAKGDRAHTL